MAEIKKRGWLNPSKHGGTAFYSWTTWGDSGSFEVADCGRKISLDFQGTKAQKRRKLRILKQALGEFEEALLKE